MKELTEAEKQSWLEAVEQAGGVTEGISKILNISRTTVWRRVKEWEWLAAAIEDQQKVCIDLALRNVRNAIESGDLKTTRWYLERKGKDLGFGRELKVDASVEQRGRVVLQLPDDGREKSE